MSRPKAATPDGQYTAELEMAYVAGNRPRATSNPFFVDTRLPQVDVSARVMLFSPDGILRFDGRGAVTAPAR